MASLEHLTDSQQLALTQLQSLTNGRDIDIEIGILESVEWDVQRAVEAIFGNATTEVQDGPKVAPETQFERMEFDDSQQHQPRPYGAQFGLGIRLIRYPFTLSISLLSSLINFIFRILRIPFPSITSIWGRTNNIRGHLPHDPASVVDRWVRQLEEDTGANRSARFDLGSSSTGAEAGPGPSTLSRRNDAIGDNMKRLPDFHLGSYEEALRICQNEARILCVVLVSEEHDDVPEFKRSTLTDPEFNALLKSNNFLVWGGDVRDRDAYQASGKLSATTYPFVAFAALQPRPRPGSNPGSQKPSLMILSRHQGPSSPNLPVSQNGSNGPTSARALCNHVNTQLLPRVTPFLKRIQDSQRQREIDRKLREAQDNAFAESAQRDRERVEARLAEERLKKQEAERLEQMRLEEEQARKQKEEEEKNKRDMWLEWCRYSRRTLLPPEPAPGAPGAVRVVVRLPKGERLNRRFLSDDTLTTLFTFIASQSIPTEYIPSDDPTTPPAGYKAGEDGISADQWPFTVASAYPRKELSWEPSVKLKDVELLKGGAQLVVEMRSRTPNGSVKSLDLSSTFNGTQAEDDDYDTEED